MGGVSRDTEQENGREKRRAWDVARVTGIGEEGANTTVFLQAEDGIRGAQESRGLGDGYKREEREREREHESGISGE